MAQIDVSADLPLSAVVSALGSRPSICVLPPPVTNPLYASLVSRAILVHCDRCEGVHERGTHRMSAGQIRAHLLSDRLGERKYNLPSKHPSMPVVTSSPAPCVFSGHNRSPTLVLAFLVGRTPHAHNRHHSDSLGCCFVFCFLFFVFCFYPSRIELTTVFLSMIVFSFSHPPSPVPPGARRSVAAASLRPGVALSTDHRPPPRVQGGLAPIRMAHTTTLHRWRCQLCVRVWV